MDIDVGGTRLLGLKRVNVILGKNGCGKSSLLRGVQGTLRNMPNEWGEPKYVTPERGGALVYDQGIESNARSNPSWYRTVLEQNQFAQYKQQTVFQFDRLQLAVLQRIAEAVEAGVTPPRRTYVEDVNSLLDNVEIRENRNDRSFKIYRKGTNDEVLAAQLSSGESELISLGIECLAYVLSLDESKQNMLILDEPDVHLHPDLQARLMRFLCAAVEQHPSLFILMATHSTAILGELSRFAYTSVCPMISGQVQLSFDAIDDAYRRILPVFGAHPLTSVFRQEPLLLVEGTDEDRIWQQVTRSSNGRICFYPVDTNGLGEMPEFESRASKVASAVYDNSRFFSLRDRDDTDGSTTDEPPLVRLKLACRASENLLLADEVLSRCGTSWTGLQSAIKEWLANNPTHSRHSTMKEFADAGFPRSSFDVKSLRLLLVDLMGSSKPWEVLVGQTIGQLDSDALRNGPPGSLAEFLGSKLATLLAEMIEGKRNNTSANI